MHYPIFQREEKGLTDVDKLLEELKAQKIPHCIQYPDFLLTVFPEVLSPRFSHSSDILMNHVTVPENGHVLDMGCGTGILSIMALKQGAEKVIALDINPQAVDNANYNFEQLHLIDKAQARISNCFSALQPNEKFDIILFNPPFFNRYSHNNLEKSCFDYKHEFFLEFLKNAPQYLNDSGIVKIIFSEGSQIENIIQEQAHNYQFELKRIPSNKHTRCVSSLHSFKPQYSLQPTFK